MNDDDRLVRLAADIADGASIQWPALEAASVTDDERDLLRELRLLERLADVHSRHVADRSAHASRDPQDDGIPLEAGAVWGPLRIVERIGGGTFGDVYRAFDERLDREVALKLLRPDAVHGAAVETLPEASVVEEGRLMARVRHPGVVTVHGAERVKGRVGVWMELVEGCTLAQEVAARGRLLPREVQQIGVHLADALAAVHRAGILHRDIKAQNVMRAADGRIVLMDFGTGVDLGDDAGVLAGTPLYLAPEVIRGGDATRQSDVYSLGVLLFHLATGAFPVRGNTLGAVRRAHARGDRQTVRQAARDVPRSLGAVIDRATAADPNRRYASAEALSGGLRAVGPEARQRRRLMMAAVAVLAVGAALSLATLRLRDDGRASVAAPAGIVEFQIDPDLQRRVQIRGPAIAGRWIPCHPRGTGGIALCDLTDGSARPLRMPQAAGERSPARRAVLSPDAQWLAYQWMREGRQGFAVHVIAVDGTRDREVYRSAAGLDIQKWTPDGSGLLVREMFGVADQRVLSIPLAGGEPRELMRFNEAVTAADLSPDGRVMLVTRDVGQQHDVSAVDIITGAELWAIAEPTDDFAALWTPDGRGVVFVSDRTGCEAIAFLPIENGHPSGPPSVVKDLGRNRATPEGFSSDGSYLLRLEHGRRTAFQTRIDLASRSAETPRPLGLRCKELSTGADWDSAGERVAFLSGTLFGSAHIVIQSRSGRIEREIQSPGSFAIFGRVRWSPDARTLAVRASGPMEMDVLYLVDITTGEHREIARGSDQRRQDDKIREIRWSPDGRTLYYQRDSDIHAFDPASSSERVIYESANEQPTFGAFDVRRTDGALVILESVDDGNDCLVRVMAVTSAAVSRGSISGTCLGAAWSADGTRILASTMDLKGESRVWLLEAEGGTPVPLPITADIFWDLSVSPDGRELLFSAGNPRPNMVLLKGLSASR